MIEKLEEMKEQIIKELEKSELESREYRYKIHYLDGKFDAIEDIIKLIESNEGCDE